MATKNVTINDVAEAAGVSRQTVTRAMNQMDRISPATRKRVLEVSERLGYRPSRFASNLARQKHHVLGLVVTTLRNPYYSDLAADLIDVAAEHGWETTVATTEHLNGVEVVERLSAQVDAIVGYFATEDEAEIARAAHGLPLVSIERPMTLPGLSTIALDFRAGVEDLIAQLRDRGSRRFAMIDSVTAGQSYVPSERQRYVEEFVGPDLLTVQATEAIQGSSEALIRIVSTEPDVDTVIGFNDLTAMGALLGAHSLGLSIPRDLRIVGIDGLSLGEAMFPALSTLAIDGRVVAEEALKMAASVAGDASSFSRTVTPRPLWRASA